MAVSSAKGGVWNGNQLGNRIALFDFDGTLTSRDTFTDFHLKRFGAAKVVTAACGALLSRPLSKIADRTKIKEAFVSSMWSGASAEEYLSHAKFYAEHEIDKILLACAMDVFLKHLELDDTVYIVTASMRDWVAFWASRYGVKVIGTEMEAVNGRLTGRFKTPNCRGQEKVSRVKAEIELDKYGRIFAYGNSAGDKEMLSIADEAVYRWERVPRLD
ncbi:hydrolase [Synergistales bacterium]|nr:hydrolase [Synergistales bacterium]